MASSALEAGGFSQRSVVVADRLSIGLVRANRITRALRRLQMTAAAMAAGDLTARVASYADDETGTLGRTFDTMADRVETMVRDLEASVVNGLYESGQHGQRAACVSTAGWRGERRWEGTRSCPFSQSNTAANGHSRS